MRQGSEQANEVIWCRYVRLADVEAYSALGWAPVGSDPLHAPHGCYSILMEFVGAGDPVEPKP